ncbi:hypothetical protein [Thalassococcus sp. S3]|uniref:hypothetical protein n=1 Tax=Thalassococcus sp. S3 TaxID=2017482 RepID=UPI00102415F0|nr:hypothetical protein [Thalassococcus sp. S3]QBF33125.1 hypothetical protein CFI11_18120 [Thalassococcus sp. S3]
MSDIKQETTHAPDNTSRTNDITSDDMMSKLKKPMTVTLPTWMFLAGGLAALILLIAALD